jgi:TolA-binding protein
MRNWKFCKSYTLGCSIIGLVSLIFATTAAAQESEAQRQFSYAKKLMDDGLLDLATTQYEEFLRIYPDSPRAPEALFFLGKSLRMQGEWYESSSQFRLLLIKYPDFARCDEALYAISENEIELGNVKGAVQSLERFPLFYPGSQFAATALLQAGDLHHSQLDFVNAEADWLHIIQDYPNSNSRQAARLRLAELYLRRRDFDTAEAQVDRLMEASPSGAMLARVGLLKAKILTERYRLEQARELYRQLFDSDIPDQWQHRAKLSYAAFLRKTGELDQAEDILAALITESTIPSLQDSTLLQWIYLNVQKGNDPEIKDTVHRLLQNSENNSLVMAALDLGIESAINSEDQESAVDFLEQYLELEKTTETDSIQLRQAYFNLTRAYNAVEMPASALELGRVALNRYAGDSAFGDRIRYELGKIYQETLNQPRQALFFFEQILAPSHHSELSDEAAFEMADCYEKLVDREQALRILGNFRSDFPGSPLIPEVEDKLEWYLIYQPEDPSAEIGRMSALFGNLLVTGAREETIFALLDQMFHKLKDYEQLIRTAGLVRQKKLLEDSNDQLNRMVGDSYYRLAVRDDISERRSAQLDSARLYLLQYLASPPPRSEQLRVAVLLNEIDKLRSDSLNWDLEFEYKFMRALVDKFSDDPGIQDLKLRLADVLLEIGLRGEKDSIAAAISVYGEIIDSEGRFLSSNGSDRGTDQLLDSVSPRERALYRRSKAYFALADTVNALADLNSYYLQFPRGRYVMDALERLGYTLLRQGKLEEAEGHFGQIIERFYYCPHAASAKINLVQIKIDRGKPEDAVRLLEGLVGATAEEQERISYLTGVAHFGAGNLLKARQSLEEYLERYPDGDHVADVYLLLAKLGKQNAQKQEWRLNYERFLNRFPDDLHSREVLLDLADDRFEEGDFSTAFEQYTRLLANSGDLVDTRVLERQRIICMIRLGDVAAAQRARTQFEKKYDDEDENLAGIDYALGNHYLDEKFFEGAEDIFKRISSKFKKTDFGAHGEYGLGKLRLVTNRTEEGLEILTRLIEKYPNAEVLPNVYLTLGDFYYKNKQFNNALSALQRCLELNLEGSLDNTVRRYLIKLYSDLGLYDSSLIGMRDYLKRYPDAEDAFVYRINMGIAMINLNEYDRAINHLRGLLRYADNDSEAEIRYWIGKSYYNMGQFRRAISEFLKVPYLTRPTNLPWHVTAEYESGLAYMKLQEWDRAKVLFDRIVKKEGGGSDFGQFAQRRLEEIEQLRQN